MSASLRKTAPKKVVEVKPETNVVALPATAKKISHALLLSLQSEQLQPGFMWAYHRTKSIANSYSIAYNGFNEMLTNRRSLYGRGFYMSRCIDHHILHGSNRTTYGHILIKSAVDMSKVLVLDFSLTEQIFGKAKTLYQQLIEAKFTTDKPQLQKELKNWSRQLYNGHELSSDVFKCMIDHKIDFKKYFDGVAYTGSQDGPCVVMYNYNKVFPVKWTEIDKSLEGLLQNDEDEMVIPIFAPMSSVINWNNLNCHEVLRVRSDDEPRFYRWLRFIEKQKPKRQISLFNLIWRKLSHTHLISFAQTVKSHPNKQLITKLLAKLSDETLLIMIDRLPQLNKYSDIFDIEYGNFNIRVSKLFLFRKVDIIFEQPWQIIKTSLTSLHDYGTRNVTRQLVESYTTSSEIDVEFKYYIAQKLQALVTQDNLLEVFDMLGIYWDKNLRSKIENKKVTTEDEIEEAYKVSIFVPAKPVVKSTPKRLRIEDDGDDDDDDD